MTESVRRAEEAFTPEHSRTVLEEQTGQAWSPELMDETAGTTVGESSVFFRKCEHTDVAGGGPEMWLDSKERVTWAILSLTKSDLYLGSSLWPYYGARFRGAQVGSCLEHPGKR